MIVNRLVLAGVCGCTLIKIMINIALMFVGKIKKILKILIQVQPSLCFILPIDSGGNTSDLVFARNCCMAKMLPREAELVSE